MDSSDTTSSGINTSTATTLLSSLADNVIRNATNISYSAANQLYSSEALDESIPKGPKDGLFLPFWPHYDYMPNIIFHGIVYFVALCYAFVGVAIIADRFMAAIEEITSQERDVIVRKANGEKEIVSVRIWNETVSNLTLMALGSSAPEILLSIIEVYAQDFNAGELGPGTIVGSAAFNMFVIIAICVWCVPTSDAKKIKHLRVFCVTVVFSVFAYIWMLFILIWNSYGVIEIWEGLLTFIFFPITVLLAYIADRRLLIYKYLSKHYRINKKVVYGGPESDGENVELTAVVDSNDVKSKSNGIEVNGNLKFIDATEDDVRDIEEQREEAIVILREIRNKNPELSIEEAERLAREEMERLRPKSRAYYRVLNARRLLGDVTDKIRDQFKKSINDYEDDEEVEPQKEGPIKVFFDPRDYTVMEDCGDFSLTVTRTGNAESTISVEYETRDGTAKAGEDYKPSKGVVSFGPGETHKQINIEVINDEEYEEDEHFFVVLSNARYLAPKQDNNQEDSRPGIEISEATANVIILDDDHSGVFSFDNNVYQIPESIGEFRLNVSRFVGARGQVSLPYRTIPNTAKENEDYIPTEGKLLFNNNDTNKEIPIRIINTDSYEKSGVFHVELGDPKRVDSDDIDKGSPRLGDLTKCLIRIRESKEFKDTVNKLIKKSRTVSAMTTSSWEDQFIEAITVPTYESPKDDEEDGEVLVRVVNKKSIFTYILHYLILFWKVMFAFVPPPSYYNGWACFTVSILVIGLLTALINDLASHFGATIGLLDSVTAISFVALGTSVPDTFASKIAAQNDKYADSSIGNVTGSNAVNVFLGIGIAWTMAAIYHFFKQTPGGFQVKPGSLSFSVFLFCIFAFVCAAVLLLRRRVVGGELGGAMKFKLPTTILFVGLWVIYIVVSSLEAYRIIPGF